MGVKQHHLTPVCFAGSAMDLYDDRSLTDEHYSVVVDTLETMTPLLPDNFVLSFKDGLLRPLLERSFTLPPCANEIVAGAGRSGTGGYTLSTGSNG